MRRCSVCPRNGWAQCAACESPIGAGGPHAHRYDPRDGKLEALCAECDYVTLLAAHYVLGAVLAVRAEHPALASAAELLRTRRIALLIQAALPL